MHIAEAIGLHVALEGVDMLPQGATHMTLELRSARRSLFQCASFLNTIISVEYGRSRVQLQDANEPGTKSHSKLAKMTSLLLRLEPNLQSGDRLEILQSLRSLPDAHPVLVLLQTDVTLHLYRKHVSLEEDRIPLQESNIILGIIKAGLSEARCLLPRRQP
jgi:hypothetical protein